MKMKIYLAVLLSIAVLTGCSSQTSLNDANEQLTYYSGGQVMGGVTSFYWYTEKLSLPYSAADYVNAGDHGWYKTEYRWVDKKLRELVRTGEQLKGDSRVIPYSLHVRFNKDGEAIYQQYRLDHKVLPLKADKLLLLTQEAANIAKNTKSQHRSGMRLIQGYWDGEKFETCTGESFHHVEFKTTLPSFVVHRLSTIDSYAAFIGRVKAKEVSVEELLMLDEDSHQCVTRPHLIDDN